MRYEWDPAKDRQNRRKHGLSFAQAVRVFEEPAACLEFFDELHSDVEGRFLTIGPIPEGLIVVAWTEREGGNVRVISARFTTARERVLYRRRREDRP